MSCRNLSRILNLSRCLPEPLPFGFQWCSPADWPRKGTSRDSRQPLSHPGAYGAKVRCLFESRRRLRDFLAEEYRPYNILWPLKSDRCYGQHLKETRLYLDGTAPRTILHEAYDICSGVRRCDFAHIFSDFVVLPHQPRP